jgi:hypothetical protein
MMDDALHSMEVFSPFRLQFHIYTLTSLGNQQIKGHPLRWRDGFVLMCNAWPFEWRVQWPMGKTGRNFSNNSVNKHSEVILVGYNDPPYTQSVLKGRSPTKFEHWQTTWFVCTNVWKWKLQANTNIEKLRRCLDLEQVNALEGTTTWPFEAPTSNRNNSVSSVIYILKK